MGSGRPQAAQRFSAVHCGGRPQGSVEATHARSGRRQGACMTTEILIAREHHRLRLREALRDGSIERLRHGAYRVKRPSKDARAVAERKRSLDRIRAVHLQLRAEHVFSHDSAALLWGMRCWRSPAKIHVLQAYRAGKAAAQDIVRRRPLPLTVATVDDIPVTDRAETVADCLRTMPPLDGLVLLDGALANGLDEDRVREHVERRNKQRGRAIARHLLDLTDPGAESAWESFLRYLADRAGLPRPQTQVPVETSEGLYRVDLGWPDHGVLAEFDGQIKYVDGAFGTEYDADEARFAEKLRDDAITAATGVRPLRFTAKDGPVRATRKLVSAFPRDVRRAARIDPMLPLPS